MSPPGSTSKDTATAERSRWFSEQVHPHEGALRSYLHGSFPTLRGNIDEVVQESYLRIWQAHAAHPISSARGFLFRIARNLALDVVRRIRSSPIDPVSRSDITSVVQDEPDAAELAGRRERIEILAEAIARLPHRCRNVFVLHKINGYSRREVAERLGLSERTVEVQTSRAIKRCAAYLRRRGVTGLYDFR